MYNHYLNVYSVLTYKYMKYYVYVYNVMKLITTVYATGYSLLFPCDKEIPFINILASYIDSYELLLLVITVSLYTAAHL